MSGFPTPETWLPHRASYGETDTMGVVYYGEYMHYFERSRSEFIRERGMSYNTVEERDIFLPVREASARYRRPIRYDALVYVRVGISDWGRASVTFTYEVYDESKQTLHATGTTQHACVNAQGKPVRVPDWLKELFV